MNQTLTCVPLDNIFVHLVTPPVAIEEFVDQETCREFLD